MAINPNTDFSFGALLTADQQNRFPRGVVAYAESTTTDAAITVEEQQYSLTFTAVANRYYKLSWFEPDTGITGAGAGAILLRFRLTTITGTQLQGAYTWVPSSAVDTVSSLIYVGTFTAGSKTIICSAQALGGVTHQLNRATGKIGFVVIEDIGPA